jgi:hypothetical protein
MPLATDVNLPKNHAARFPSRCVVCGAPSPESTVRLMTGSIGWWTWLLWHFGNPFTVRAPACKHCSWRLHLTRVSSSLITIAGIAAACWLFWPWVSAKVPRPARKWALMGLALACLLPQFLYEMVFPHPFSITAYSDSVDYEFRDRQMAIEFALLNLDAECVKVNTVKIEPEDLDPGDDD